MTNATPAEFQAKLDALCASFAAQLPEKLDLIDSGWIDLLRNEWDAEAFQSLRRRVHSLTGSGKMFGFPLLSDAARNLEEYFDEIAASATAPDEEQRQRVQVLLRELRPVGKPGP